MINYRKLILVLTSVSLPIILSLNIVLADNWPQWRGPMLNGTSREQDLPVNWSMTENIAWKLAMPDRSASAPIIWGDRIFLNVADGKEIYLWCVDGRQGSVLWKRLLGGENRRQRKQNMSSPSPVTDGKNVWVMTGTGIVKSFDFSGKEIWARNIQKDYGQFGMNHGYSSSPLLYEDALYVQVVHGTKTDAPSYILRIDTNTGRTVWRIERPSDAVRESLDSYATPALLKEGETTQIVILGGDCITGHDMTTGKELWRGKGLNPTRNPVFHAVASPVIFDGIIYAPARVKPLTAFRTGGLADITNTHRLWISNFGPHVSTPVTDGKYFYSVSDNGVLSCLDAKTGEVIYGRQRLKSGDYSSSPVLADSKLYLTNEDGLTSVVKAGPKFEVLAENQLDGYCLSTPAISNSQIFIRTSEYLYCIGEKKRMKDGG
ncbi:MAG: PQQ-like beta-propeller repeat protein [Acidobacteria bacterium]|nr:PQQ-like beta-propeller repeat protein [Acidobacteriota bacterium]